MFEQAAVSSPKAETKDGGLLPLLKAADWVLPAFWNNIVEYLFDDGEGDGMLRLL